MPIDYKKYHPKWKLISSWIRFKRAGNKCEKCGAENYKPNPATGSKVILTVAHLDRDRANNRFWNLAALCQRCHLRHDLQQHLFNRKYGRNWKENQYSFIEQLNPVKSNNAKPEIGLSNFRNPNFTPYSHLNLPKISAFLAQVPKSL